jgi:hypothetical protein
MATDNEVRAADYRFLTMAVPSISHKYLDTRETDTMTNWNQLLQILDRTIGFPNKASSTVKKVKEAYDDKRNEHVIWLEYRIKISNDGPMDLRQPATKNRDMAFLRQLSTAMQSRRDR